MPQTSALATPAQLQLREQERGFVPGASSMATSTKIGVWWTQEMLDMSIQEVNTLVAAFAHAISPESIKQLKLARRRKKNREYAANSRLRRVLGVSAAAHKAAQQATRMQGKIDRLVAANDQLRNSCTD